MFLAILSTIAEPTTTPSATWAISVAISGFLTPKPAQTGSEVFCFILAISDFIFRAVGEAAPVIPVIET